MIILLFRADISPYSFCLQAVERPETHRFSCCKRACERFVIGVKLPSDNICSYSFVYKPSSDLKLIAFLIVSELASDS